MLKTTYLILALHISLVHTIVEQVHSNATFFLKPFVNETN